MFSKFNLSNFGLICKIVKSVLYKMSNLYKYNSYIIEIDWIEILKAEMKLLFFYKIFELFLKKEGVTPVNFLNAVLKVAFE
jgi:hypothetical protein